jgi:hypothetical protein
LNFPTIRVQRVSATEDEELENDGNAALNISDLNPGVNTQLDPVATTCSTTAAIPSALNCVIGAQFAPTVIGNPVTGTITATSNSPNTPQTVTLKGQVLTLDPSSITLNTSGSPSATGALVTFTVTVTSTGVTPTGTVTFLDGSVTIGTAFEQCRRGGVSDAVPREWDSYYYGELRRRCQYCAWYICACDSDRKRWDHHYRDVKSHSLLARGQRDFFCARRWDVRYSYRER